MGHHLTGKAGTAVFRGDQHPTHPGRADLAAADDAEVIPGVRLRRQPRTVEDRPPPNTAPDGEGRPVLHGSAEGVPTRDERDIGVVGRHFADLHAGLRYPADVRSAWPPSVWPLRPPRPPGRRRRPRSRSWRPTGGAVDRGGFCCRPLGCPSVPGKRLTGRPGPGHRSAGHLRGARPEPPAAAVADRPSRTLAPRRLADIAARPARTGARNCPVYDSGRRRSPPACPRRSPGRRRTHPPVPCR